MGIVSNVITATPEQVEKQWDILTQWQRDQVSLARLRGKSLHVTVLDLGVFKVLYSVDVKE